MRGDPPGSKEAIAKGCCCPVDDNYGSKTLFWINEECPLHGIQNTDGTGDTNCESCDKCET